MKVAIVGVGPAGMACAYVLKKNGIIPTIFEKKSYSGEVLDFPAIIMNIFNVIINDPLEYLNKKYEIKITPHYQFNELVLVSPSNSYIIKGNLGSIILRGREKKSLHNQIVEVLNLPIKFNCNINIEDIKDDYDHILVTTAQTDLVQQMNLLTVHFDAWVRIADISGSFKIGSVKVWMNTKYAKHGYAYMIASSTTKANLILVVDNITSDQLNYYWEEFLTSENIKYNIHRTKDIRHTIGIVCPVQVDNLYFAGHSGGFIDSLLGFGSINSLLSGALAAECIINGLDYNKESQPYIKDLKRKHEFRKVYNTFDNDMIDLFVTMENLPIIKQYIFNNPLFKVTQGTLFAKAYNSIIKNPLNN